MKIRVLVTEDNVITMSGLEQILSASDDIEVVARAYTAASALAEAKRERPDVALVDLVLPDEDGITLAKRMLALKDPPRVLILTAFHDDSQVEEALRTGVSGFLLKDLIVDDLLEGIRAAFIGHAVLHPAVARRMVDALRHVDHTSPEEQEQLDTLTDREIAVLRLMALGMTNARIGQKLGLSEANVKHHVAQIFAKLGMRSRVQVARFANRMGING